MIPSKIVTIQTAVANLRLKIFKEDILLDVCGNLEKWLLVTFSNYISDIFINFSYQSGYHCWVMGLFLFDIQYNTRPYMVAGNGLKFEIRAEKSSKIQPTTDPAFKTINSFLHCFYMPVQQFKRPRIVIFFELSQTELMKLWFPILNWCFKLAIYNLTLPRDLTSILTEMELYDVLINTHYHIW